MHLQERFIEFIRKENLFQADEPLLLAVSGGVDSVVMCELCYQADYKFVIAHCNFRLRDKESERDKEFVEALAKKYGVEILIKEFDTQDYAFENKISIQEAARELRYNWFNKIIKKQELRSNPLTSVNGPLPTANWILTAHHADDNIETMLMNFFRGTGIQGLRGILPKQEKVVRPLLLFKKAELLQFANEQHLNWVEDSSNQFDKYSRNYFRNNVIPLIKSIYPQVEQNLLNNLQRFGEIETLYRQSVARHLENLLEQKGNEVRIPVLKLKKTQPLFAIVHEIIKPYNFTSGQVQELIRLMDSDTGKYIQSPTHKIFKNRNWLIISPRATEQAENILIEEPFSHIMFALGELHFQATQVNSHQTQTNSDTAYLSAEEITFPLLLRKWKTGDYFYPLGMKKKKKLARFFIDQKLSKTDKENAWVIEMNKKIIWVVGMRIDERFKVTPAATEILVITLKRNGMFAG
jgi:tRNA(Ile)-lysidine synthase